jgi:death-on-curing protein
VIFLDLDSLLHIATRVLGGDPSVRDYGLLESALARPQATAFGEDAYPDEHEKAAALLHSLTRNHALVDGNKRLALAATIAFLGINGQRLTFTNDEAYELVIAIATGELDDVPSLAAALGHNTAPRPSAPRRRAWPPAVSAG